MKCVPLIAFSVLLLSSCTGSRLARRTTMPATPAQVVEGLLSQKADERFRAASGYRQLDEAKRTQVFDALFLRLMPDKGEDFPSAAEALATLGAPIVPSLMSKFTGADDMVRHRVAWTLSQMPNEAGEAEYLMKAALRDPALHVRY